MNAEYVTVARSLSSERLRVGKLPTSEYRMQGRYPIIDQGREKIAGYTDQEDLAYTGPLPVIVFGDHTRAIKLIEEPFVAGADGTKLLYPRPDLFDPVFFYFALLSLHIPSRGYNRHWRLLRDMKLPAPPVEEQRRIAQMLSTLFRAREAHLAVAMGSKKVLASLLGYYFSEDSPESVAQGAMSPVPISDCVADITTGDWGTAEQTGDRVECIVVRATDFERLRQGDTSQAPHRFLSPSSIAVRQVLAGDLLVEMSGGSEAQPTGRMIRVPNDGALLPVLTFSNFVKRLRLVTNVDSHYFSFVWQWLYSRGRTKPYEKRTTGIRNFRLDDFLASELVVLPSLERQRQIAGDLAAVESASYTEDKLGTWIKRVFDSALAQLLDCTA